MQKEFEDSFQDHLKEFEDFYKNRFKEYGPTPQGVGWKNEDAQRIRFQQLVKIISPKDSLFSINDLGCGVGDLANFLKLTGFQFEYRGYDELPMMVEKASKNFAGVKNVSIHLVKSAQEMTVSDYTVASGIFNPRLNCTDDVWSTHIQNTLWQMNKNSERAFAFNILSSYSDAEFMKQSLYYADPMVLFDFCKRNFSRHVSVIHDYGQYDFTVIVRKNI